MTTTTQVPAFEPTNQQLELRPRTLWNDAWKRLRQSPVALICMAIVALYVLVGLASFLPVFEHTNAQGQPEGLIWNKVGESYQAPSWSRPGLWLGADIMGRSVFWRLLYGTRVALTLAVCAGLISIVIGVGLGVAAGYFGKWIDDIIVWLFTTVSSVPWILLVMALTFVFKTMRSEGGEQIIGDLWIVILALGLTDWVGLCRLIRGEVMKLRELDYVVSARALGIGHTRILFRHILPNVFHIVIITFSLAAVGFVQAEVVLAFLGLGITQKPSWGRMIDDSKLELLRGVWWQLTGATIAIFVLCLALNLLGDVLRDALDPRLRGVD